MASDPDPVNSSGPFEVVRRGYARDQVDASVHELERRAQVADNARRMAEQHAAGLAEELRVLRAGTAAEGLPAAPQSFGFRAEKVVRLAEREAADLRAAATRDAEQLRAATLHEAERLRAAAERDAAGIRDAAERTATEILESATREGGEIRSAATREAADLLERSHSDAAGARADAAAERAALVAHRAEAAAIRDETERERARLRGLRGTVREELSRLHSLLGAQLQGLAGSLPAVPAEAPDATPAASPPAEAPMAPEQLNPGLFDTPPRPVLRVPVPRAGAADEDAGTRPSLRSG